MFVEGNEAVSRYFRTGQLSQHKPAPEEKGQIEKARFQESIAKFKENMTAIQ